MSCNESDGLWVHWLILYLLRFSPFFLLSLIQSFNERGISFHHISMLIYRCLDLFCAYIDDSRTHSDVVFLKWICNVQWACIMNVLLYDRSLCSTEATETVCIKWNMIQGLSTGQPGLLCCCANPIVTTALCLFVTIGCYRIWCGSNSMRLATRKCAERRIGNGWY